MKIDNQKEIKEEAMEILGQNQGLINHTNTNDDNLSYNEAKFEDLSHHFNVEKNLHDKNLKNGQNDDDIVKELNMLGLNPTKINVKKIK